jgi:hypothetical protein
MTEVTSEHIRSAIAAVREFAESEAVAFDDAQHLAREWWTRGDHNGHHDWYLLGDDAKTMWTQFAAAALREIETGQLTPEK